MFPNMYGASAGANDLTGMTNAEVADFYCSLFRRKKREAIQLGLGGPTKMDAQTMAVALSVYVTNETLAGTIAENFGFLVTANGVGVSTFNVGSNGDAFNVEDDSDLTILDLLLATNSFSMSGVLYDLDGDSDAVDDIETLLRIMANDVFSAINEQGDHLSYGTRLSSIALLAYRLTRPCKITLFMIVLGSDYGQSGSRRISMFMDKIHVTVLSPKMSNFISYEGIKH